MRQLARSAALAGLLLTLGVSSAHARGAASPEQDPQGDASHGEGRGGSFAGMAHTMGEVKAVSGTTLTLKAEDGSTMQIVTTDNTRVMKDRAPVKITDLHPGDGLMALGILDAPNKTLHAAMIFAQDAAEVKALRENLGKTYITGRVTAIDLDNAKATVERADHVAQTIGFDETTSFKRAVRGGNNGPGPANQSSEADGSARGAGRSRGPGFGGGMGMGGAAMGAGFDRAFTNGESITLADIKVGDLLSGTGSLKNNVFVPSRVVDSPPRPHRSHTGEEVPAAGASATSSGPDQR